MDTILTWAVSPFVLGGICIILAFLLSLTHSQRRYYERDREKVRTELETFRREVKAKVRAQALPLHKPIAAFLSFHICWHILVVLHDTELDRHACHEVLAGRIVLIWLHWHCWLHAVKGVHTQHPISCKLIYRHERRLHARRQSWQQGTGWTRAREQQGWRSGRRPLPPAMILTQSMRCRALPAATCEAAWWQRNTFQCQPV